MPTAAAGDRRPTGAFGSFSAGQQRGGGGGRRLQSWPGTPEESDGTGDHGEYQRH